MAHRLDPLLNPASIAVMGASDRPGSVGRQTVHNLLAGEYPGTIYPINPGRDEVLGLKCHAHLSDLPETAEHVIFALNDARMEAAVGEAIDHGCAAATIMSQLVVRDDPQLGSRIEQRILESGLLVCGPNGMGFYNGHDGVWACGFDTRENHIRGGNVTLISHSGAGMCGIVDCEERIDFNLAVSTGQELNVGMADYIDYVLEQHQPRVIGLFMETARDAPALKAALQKAAQQSVPVVALKVGRTELSSKLAQSHSGAIAGEDAAFEALFDHYGVQRVRDMDEFTAALILFAQPHPVGAGGLASIHDSGGERQLLIDLCDDLQVPLAEISKESTQQLEKLLDPGLPAVNPLDAWGAGGPDSHQIMQQSLATLMKDPGTALGAVVHDRAPYGKIYTEYLDYMRAGHDASGKPVVLVANHQGTGSDPIVVESTRCGFPIIDGLRPFLVGVNCLLGYRDFAARAPVNVVEVDVTSARSLLEAGSLDEAAALAFLDTLGLPVNHSRRVSSEMGALHAASELGYPVVLKTAADGIQHKTDQLGVHLDLKDPDALVMAWRDLETRLGPSALVAPMVKHDGLEMVLGMVQDELLGPLVMLGMGGTHIEAIRDVVFALPPFDAPTARRVLSKLKQSSLLEFDRGRGKPDLDTYCEVAARFSSIVSGLEGELAEIDINPIMVNPQGCLIVDALVIGKHAAH